MTLIASVVDRSFFQQAFCGTAVWIVTARAHHLAFAHRHVGGAEHLCAPVLMTLEAGIRLECRLELELARYFLHDRVAIGAGHIPHLVDATIPISPLPLFVAAETDGVVLLHCAGWIIAPKGNDPAHAAPALGVDMGRAGTVAGFALRRRAVGSPGSIHTAHESLMERPGLSDVTSQASLL